MEDEPKLVEIMTRILHKHGYRTVYAVTADDGLEGAQRLAPALITIDMGLPVRPRAISAQRPGPLCRLAKRPADHRHSADPGHRT